jgi:hypothetical protein
MGVLVRQYSDGGLYETTIDAAMIISPSEDGKLVALFKSEEGSEAIAVFAISPGDSFQLTLDDQKKSDGPQDA